MGIPSYFSHLCRTYPEVIQEWKSQTIHNLYLDSNSIVYDSLRSLEYQGQVDFEQTLIEKVCETIDEYIKTVQPSYSVFICFDGVAPVAKLEQQRNRRFKSSFMEDVEEKLSTTKLSKWDKTAITPGTNFMMKLNEHIEEYYARPELPVLLGLPALNIRVSTSNERGEGEHKIFEHIRNNPQHLQQTTVIYGLDADLIVLSLNHLQYGRIYLFRETPSFVQNFSHLEPNQSYLLDIKRLSSAILTEMTGITFEPTAMAKMRMYDYILLTFLLGNDFLPHFPGICLRTRGMDILMDTYRHLFGRGTKMNTKTLCVKRGKSIQIHWQTFRIFIQELAKRERQDWIEEYKIRAKWERMDIKMDTTDEEGNEVRVPVDKIEIHQVRDAGMATLLHIPVKQREWEHYINPQQGGWERRYYETLFQTHVSNNEMRKISINYLEGLEWVLTYYSGSCKDWRWHYRYHYPPLLSDLKNYIPSFQQPILRETNSREVSPLVQLMYVLPHSALGLLPEYIQTKINQNKVLKELYPREADFVWVFCRYFWECHVNLPKIDIQMLESII